MLNYIHITAVIPKGSIVLFYVLKENNLLIFPLEFFVSIFVKEIGLIFKKISLSGFDVKVMLALYNV